MLLMQWLTARVGNVRYSYGQLRNGRKNSLLYLTVLSGISANKALRQVKHWPDSVALGQGCY